MVESEKQREATLYLNCSTEEEWAPILDKVVCVYEGQTNTSFSTQSHKKATLIFFKPSHVHESKQTPQMTCYLNPLFDTKLSEFKACKDWNPLHHDETETLFYFHHHLLPTLQALSHYFPKTAHYNPPLLCVIQHQIVHDPGPTSPYKPTLKWKPQKDTEASPHLPPILVPPLRVLELLSTQKEPLNTFSQRNLRIKNAPKWLNRVLECFSQEETQGHLVEHQLYAIQFVVYVMGSKVKFLVGWLSLTTHHQIRDLFGLVMLHGKIVRSCSSFIPLKVLLFEYKKYGWSKEARGSFETFKVKFKVLHDHLSTSRAILVPRLHGGIQEKGERAMFIKLKGSKHKERVQSAFKFMIKSAPPLASPRSNDVHRGRFKPTPSVIGETEGNFARVLTPRVVHTKTYQGKVQTELMKCAWGASKGISLRSSKVYEHCLAQGYHNPRECWFKSQGKGPKAIKLAKLRSHNVKGEQPPSLRSNSLQPGEYDGDPWASITWPFAM